jgi:hypothetical protein
MLIEIYPSCCVLRRAEPFVLPAGNTLIVPEGYRTDLASVPRWLRSFFPFAAAWQRAAVLHDFLYDEKGLNVTRRQADYLFRWTMAGDHVGLPTRWLMWVAVRAFGWIYWTPREVPAGMSPRGFADWKG